MSVASEIADLLQRDLTRLLQEIDSFPNDEAPWKTLPGVGNSAGNLILHLEGNMREFIGRQIGGVAFERKRDLEFNTTGLSVSNLKERIGQVKELAPPIVAGLSAERLDSIFPQQVSKIEMTTRQFLIHLMGHLSYHLGQIDYLRRIVTSGQSVPFVNL